MYISVVMCVSVLLYVSVVCVSVVTGVCHGGYVCQYCMCQWCVLCVHMCVVMLVSVVMRQYVMCVGQCCYVCMSVLLPVFVSMSCVFVSVVLLSAVSPNWST